jgi:hypothetical protein
MGSSISIEDELNDQIEIERKEKEQIESDLNKQIEKQDSIIKMNQDLFDEIIDDIVEELRYDLRSYTDKIEETCKKLVLRFEKEHFENNLNSLIQKVRSIKINEFMKHYNENKFVYVFKDVYPTEFYTDEMYKNDIEINCLKGHKIIMYKFGSNYRIEIKQNLFQKLKLKLKFNLKFNSRIFKNRN